MARRHWRETLQETDTLNLWVMSLCRCVSTTAMVAFHLTALRWRMPMPLQTDSHFWQSAQAPSVCSLHVPLADVTKLMIRLLAISDAPLWRSCHPAFSITHSAYWQLIHSDHSMMNRPKNEYFLINYIQTCSSLVRVVTPNLLDPYHLPANALLTDREDRVQLRFFRGFHPF